MKKIEVVKALNDYRVIETIEKFKEERGVLSIHVLFNGTRKECFDYIKERKMKRA